MSEPRMPFGKYRGLPLSALPADYLHWLLGLEDLREPFRSAIQAEAARRQPARVHRPSLDPTIALALIDAGLRQLAKRHHPDAGGDVRIMQRVNEAADVLRATVRGLAA